MENRTCPDDHISTRTHQSRVQPDGRMLASGSDDYTIRLFDTAEGTPLHTLEGHELDIISVVFSPTGGALASVSGDKTVRLWDTKTGRGSPHPSTGNGRNEHGFHPGGRRSSNGGINGSIDFWTPKPARINGAEGAHCAVNSLAFSSDGGTLVSGSLDGTILLWAYPR